MLGTGPVCRTLLFVLHPSPHDDGQLSEVMQLLARWNDRPPQGPHSEPEHSSPSDSSEEPTENSWNSTPSTGVETDASLLMDSVFTAFYAIEDRLYNKHVSDLATYLRVGCMLTFDADDPAWRELGEVDERSFYLSRTQGEVEWTDRNGCALLVRP